MSKHLLRNNKPNLFGKEP